MLPFIELFGLRLPTYGLMLLLGTALCVLLSLRRCKLAGLSTDSAIIILACAGGMAFIGSKLLYLLVSVPTDVLMRAVRAGEWRAIMESGQVFYGGVIGGVAGAAVGMRIAPAKAGPYLRAIVPAIPLGHAVGRVGCLLAGCCYGIPYSGPLAVVYRRPVGGAPTGVGLFPVQGLEALMDVFLFFMLLYASKKMNSGMRLALLYSVLYAFIRLLLEYLRYDRVRGIVGLFSTSQWISMFLLLLGGTALLLFRKLFTRQTDQIQ